MVRFPALFLSLAMLAGGGDKSCDAQQQKPKQKQDPKAVLKVVQAIDAECVANASLKDALKGDALTEKLIRVAAAEALKQPKEVQLDAFLTGVGIGLDRANFLAQNIVTRGSFGGIEDPAAAKIRQENIRKKKVSIGDRTDWAQHWACSLGMAGRLGAATSESLGLAKEAKDLLGDSGWSWTDVAADAGGIELAERLRLGKITLKQVEENFTVAKVLIPMDGLDDKLDQEQFKTKYKTIGSDAYKKQHNSIKKSVAAHFDSEWPLPKK